MPVIITDERTGGNGVFADTVFEADRGPTHSRLLGPNGSPLAYANPSQPIGFDLKPATPKDNSK